MQDQSGTLQKKNDDVEEFIKKLEKLEVEILADYLKKLDSKKLAFLLDHQQEFFYLIKSALKEIKKWFYKEKSIKREIEIFVKKILDLDIEVIELFLGNLRNVNIIINFINFEKLKELGVENIKKFLKYEDEITNLLYEETTPKLVYEEEIPRLVRVQCISFEKLIKIFEEDNRHFLKVMEIFRNNDSEFYTLRRQIMIQIKDVYTSWTHKDIKIINNIKIYVENFLKLDTQIIMRVLKYIEKISIIEFFRRQNESYFIKLIFEGRPLDELISLDSEFLSWMSKLDKVVNLDKAAISFVTHKSGNIKNFIQETNVQFEDLIPLLGKLTTFGEKTINLILENGKTVLAFIQNTNLDFNTLINLDPVVIEKLLTDPDNAVDIYRTDGELVACKLPLPLSLLFFKMPAAAAVETNNSPSIDNIKNEASKKEELSGSKKLFYSSTNSNH